MQPAIMDHEQPHIVAAEKPQWFKSPLASDRLRRPSEAPPPLHPHTFLQVSEECAVVDGPGGVDDYENGYPPFKRVRLLCASTT